MGMPPRVTVADLEGRISELEAELEKERQLFRAACQIADRARAELAASKAEVAKSRGAAAAAAEDRASLESVFRRLTAGGLPNTFAARGRGGDPVAKMFRKGEGR